MPDIPTPEDFDHDAHYAYLQHYLDMAVNENLARAALSRVCTDMALVGKMAENRSFVHRPHVLQLVGPSENKYRRFTIGQRYHILNAVKKLHGNFEVVGVRVVHDEARDRRFGSHALNLRRVLKTKVSEASDNRICLDVGFLNASNPFSTWNAVVAETLEFIAESGYYVAFVEAQDPRKVDRADMSPDHTVLNKALAD